MRSLILLLCLVGESVAGEVYLSLGLAQMESGFIYTVSDSGEERDISDHTRGVLRFGYRARINGWSNIGCEYFHHSSVETNSDAGMNMRGCALEFSW